MDDERIWDFERGLWQGGEDVYRARLDEACLMALPEQPFVFDSAAAFEAVSHTPRWDEVEFSDQRVSRPEEGLIVIAYRASASSGDKHYHALCSSTLRRLAHEDWRIVQHQQTPFATNIADPLEG